MLTILHGENVVASRDKLIELITQAKDKNKAVERLDAKKLDLGTLETKLVKQDLFGTERIVIIEGLHSLPRSKQKSLSIELISQSQVEIILWEKRQLTPSMLKKLSTASIFEFKLSNALFNWLDTLRGNGKNQAKQLETLHQALEIEDPHLCLVMLARQIRMLIQIKDNGVIKGPPWMVSKLKKQGQTFELKQLLDLHTKLLEIDLRQKTSTNTLELDQELDLLLLSM
jgi:hypothetical protein